MRDVRDSSDPRLMEVFLSAYGLSTKEGVALMCLAEALLRVPDTETMDELIRDKIAPHDWSAHSGGSIVDLRQRLDLGADADRHACWTKARAASKARCAPWSAGSASR